MKWQLSWALEDSAQPRNDYPAPQAFRFEYVLTSCISISQHSTSILYSIAPPIILFVTSRKVRILLSLYYRHGVPFCTQLGLRGGCLLLSLGEL